MKDDVNATTRSVPEYHGYTPVDVGAVYGFNEKVAQKTAIYNLTNAEINNDDNGAVLNGLTLWAGMTFEF